MLTLLPTGYYKSRSRLGCLSPLIPCSCGAEVQKRGDGSEQAEQGQNLARTETEKMEFQDKV